MTVINNQIKYKCEYQHKCRKILTMKSQKMFNLGLDKQLEENLHYLAICLVHLEKRKIKIIQAQKLYKNIKKQVKLT